MKAKQKNYPDDDRGKQYFADVIVENLLIGTGGIGAGAL
jgi:hypothetical protein